MYIKPKYVLFIPESLKGNPDILNLYMLRKGYDPLSKADPAQNLTPHLSPFHLPPPPAYSTSSKAGPSIQ